MTKNRFLISLVWELKTLFRFPLPEILLALFTYMVFLPSGGMAAGTFDLENLSWQKVTYRISFVSAYRGALHANSAYLPMVILASIFATLTFAYEIENGTLKVHLSHPTGRGAIFLSKFLSCFLIVFTTLSCTLLFFIFLYIPENALYLIIYTVFPLKILLLTALESFFIVSFMVSFSIFSRRTAISLIGSFATIYILQLLGEAANLTFLPPASFYEQVEYLFSWTSPKLDLMTFLINPIVATILVITSYIYFSRRLELT
jgi:ABC-type transport system involved in multi-copper enzyme maturation permease subunit